MKNKLVLESKATIRFQDCDPFNHLNNGNYINYFMNHREDQVLANYNLDIYKMAKTIGKSWVSGSNQIVYFKPAYTMETVLIESQLYHFTDSELHVEMRMYDENKKYLKSVIWSSFIHFNLLEQKREKHSEELMQIFKSFHNPLEENIFEERIKAIKKRKVILQ
mgnify:CR=1 FL=1